ncbi:MAG: TetR/AcrR family transcriptional regulator [Rectinema sp.]
MRKDCDDTGKAAISCGSGEKIRKAAVQLFAEKWYGTVSVAEICRRAGLSNGCFYRYYRTKEELFRALLEDVNDRIATALDGVTGDTVIDRLRSFASIVFHFSQDNHDLVRVFREGQYRFFEYEHRLKAIYIAALEKALGDRIDLADYIFALGGLRFTAVRAAFHDIPIRLDALQGILENGLFPDMEADPEKVYSGTIKPLPFEVAPDARERLMLEGKKLFGKRGFFETNIHEITDAAELSVGAFYTYFESKESFYAELIHRVGSEVRHFISLNLGPGLNRYETELRGLWLFIVYLSLDPHCYNIVREAEFVLPENVKSYYGAFVQGYRKHAEGSGGIDETTSIEFLLGVAHYFGLEVVFDESPGNARALIQEIGAFLRGGLSARLSK